MHSTKKNVLAIVCFLSLMPSGIAQSEQLGLMAADSKPFHVDLKVSKNHKVAVNNYGWLIIKDMRPDNSKMGYVRLDYKSSERHIVFPKNGEEYLNKIFNSAIRADENSDTVIVALNDIWFNESRTEAAMAHKLLLGQQKLVSSCYMNASVYRKRDEGYVLLGKFDSIFTKKGEWLPNNCEKLLERATLDLVRTCDKLLLQPEAESTFYTAEQYDSVMQVPLHYPILKADKPAKGIYFSYNDFLNNKPASIHFTVISEIKRTIDYPGRKKQDSVWGYSDGENIYMHIGPGYYKLFRSKGTYEVFGPATVVIMNTFFEKAFRVAGMYYSSPKIPFNYFSPVSGRLLDATPFFEPDTYAIEYFKNFRLDMQRGFLN